MCIVLHLNLGTRLTYRAGRMARPYMREQGTTRRTQIGHRLGLEVTQLRVVIVGGQKDW